MEISTKFFNGREFVSIDKHIQSVTFETQGYGGEYIVDENGVDLYLKFKNQDELVEFIAMAKLSLDASIKKPDSPQPCSNEDLERLKVQIGGLFI